MGDAKKLDDACSVQFNGIKGGMNILPPPELGDAKLGDYWSLALALLNLGGKLQPIEDVETGGGSSSITETLFTVAADDAGCWVLKESSGLLFQEGDRPTVTKSRKEHIRNMIKPNKADHGKFLFEYLWFVWNKKDDLSQDISGKIMTGIIPGYGQDPAALNTGKNKDKHYYLDLLTARMATSRREMAKQWVQGHLRWDILQGKLNEKDQLWTATKSKIQGKTVTNEFVKSEVGYYKDIGILYYGIPTNTVIEIFKMLTSKFPSISQSVNLSNPASLLDLNYDSFSDAELDEFEASLEPYDEEELDKLMEGAITGMAKEAYDSSSDSAKSLSYDSSSDTVLSETAVSYDSSSDSGSGAAVSYNSESEQSFHNSEHGASYDSDSDEDR